jgi:hypothetical protein
MKMSPTLALSRLYAHQFEVALMNFDQFAREEKPRKRMWRLRTSARRTDYEGRIASPTAS